MVIIHVTNHNYDTIRINMINHIHTNIPVENKKVEIKYNKLRRTISLPDPCNISSTKKSNVASGISYVNVQIFLFLGALHEEKSPI